MKSLLRVNIQCNSHLHDVDILQSLHRILTDEVLDVNDILVSQRQQNSHLPQSSLKIFLLNANFLGKYFD